MSYTRIVIGEKLTFHVAAVIASHNGKAIRRPNWAEHDYYCEGGESTRYPTEEDRLAADWEFTDF